MYRAIFNYLSDTESAIDFKRLRNPKKVYDTIQWPNEIYDWIIDIATHLKEMPRDLTGKQTIIQDPDIDLPSNN